MIKLLLYEILEQLIKEFQMSICQHAHSHQALGNQSNTEMPQVINFTVSEITWKENTDVGIEERRTGAISHFSGNIKWCFYFKKSNLAILKKYEHNST